MDPGLRAFNDFQKMGRIFLFTDANREHRKEFYIKVAIKNVAKNLPNLMRTIN